jgi:crossover junction endodeoxyribonuclease RuvC
MSAASLAEDALTLGIDPGTAIMGYGLVTQRDTRLVAVAYGAFTTPAGERPAERLRLLYEELTALIRTYRPTTMGVEELFFNQNVRTALAVGQARGIALLCAAQAGIAVAEYTPLQVKQAVVGYGRATKEQVGLMVRTLLGLREVPRPDDTADALAVAICHVHSARMAAPSTGRAPGRTDTGGREERPAAGRL